MNALLRSHVVNVSTLSTKTTIRQPIRYAQTVSPLWLALTKAVDFSRPDADESRLHEAIMQSEGLPRHRVASRK